MMSLASVKALSEQPEICAPCLCPPCLCPPCLCESEQGSPQLQEEENGFELREEALKKECEERIEKEITKLKERFDLILQNEEVRSSWLLREAHRGREEKISALKTQLECKNLAALMYLLCSERRKNRLETMQMVEEYTNHIDNLMEILKEGQNIMEEMASGYRTAEQVDTEWRTKTEAIIQEFQRFLEHYFGNPPESSKFYFNMPELLRLCAPLNADDIEKEESIIVSCGPTCDCVDCGEEAPPTEEDDWLTKLSTSNRPFVVFGDMSDFNPTQRRQLLKQIKEEKRPAPDKWTQYALNNKFLIANCPNADWIKQKYLKSCPADDHRQCLESSMPADYERLVTGCEQGWKDGNLDIGHGPLASIMRMVTQAMTLPQHMGNKASLLGARDSLELISTTKVLGKRDKKKADICDDAKLSLMSEEIYPISLRSMGKKRASMAPDVESRILDSTYSVNDPEIPERSVEIIKADGVSDSRADDLSEYSKLASIHQDSLQFVGSHSPNRSEADRVVREKECPVTSCQRKHADGYLRNLPPYMDFRSPYWEYERTFDFYEPCTTEHLERVVRLKSTFERGGKSEKDEASLPCLKSDLGHESRTDAAIGVAVQTSDVSMCLCHILPPCSLFPTCSTIFMDAPPVSPKMNKDHITTSQLYDDTIQFDRFEVIGENQEKTMEQLQDDFARDRVGNIMKIMKKHPSMYSMFQATAKC